MVKHSRFDKTLGYIQEVNRFENAAEDLVQYERVPPFFC